LVDSQFYLPELMPEQKQNNAIFVSELIVGIQLFVSNAVTYTKRSNHWKKVLSFVRPEVGTPFLRKRGTSVYAG